MVLADLRRGRWPSILLSLAAGAVAAVAHPPFGVLPGLLGYALLLWRLDRAADLRSAFWRAWLAGVAYFGVGVWWVTEAFMVDAEHQGWMAPFALAFMAAGLGVFWGLAGLLYRRLAPPGWTRLLVFAGLLSLLEELRGLLLFPWNPPGAAWAAGSPPSQLAAVVGVNGLTWLTLAIAAAPALLVARRERKAGLAVVAAALVALAGLYGFGLARLHGAAPSPAAGPLVRIVQADVKQAAKYDQAYFQDIVMRYVRLTAQPSARRPDIVVWPEGAIPVGFADYMAPGTWTRRAIEDALQPGQVLILGGYHVEGTQSRPIYKNSLFVLSRSNAGIDLLGVYDKHRLVPFGEFLPLERLIEPLGVKQLVHVGDGFTPGPPPTPMTVPGAGRLQPLICYESLFPALATSSKGRADWLANISNDAWFGQTSGPWQHLNLASYRAIEQGLPMIRATPTGISAAIDAYGRVAPGAERGPGEFGVIDTILPRGLGQTSYSRYGDLIFLLLVALSISSTVRHLVRFAKRT